MFGSGKKAEAPAAGGGGGEGAEIIVGEPFDVFSECDRVTMFLFALFLPSVCSFEP